MFSPPFNWCDRRCERCRLSPLCGVPPKVSEQPSDLGAALLAALHATMDALEQIARQQGVDLDSPAPPRPLAAARMRRLKDVLSPADLSSPDGIVVYTKICRLAEQLDEPEADEVYVFDTVPNLLLLERLIEWLHPATAAALRDELAPLLGRIDVGLRRAMDAMVQAGVAPSPFCFSDEAQPDIERAA